MESNPSEQWRDVPGFEGVYQVSDQGRVRSLDRISVRVGHNGKQQQHRLRGRILRPSRIPSGHVQVMGNVGSKKVHSLVALAFIGPRPPDKEVRHLNGIPVDNRLENLEYATRSRNVQDRKWHAGGNNYVLKPADVLDIKRRLGHPSRGLGASLAREYRVKHTTISDIKRGRFHKDVVL
jgi:NUMOD4 motif/HNH endonuclease